MCTLTWIKNPNGCRIYFNRDEKRTRLPATPPSNQVIEGVRVLAPNDGNAGGSWLAVNEFALAVAILNYYEAEAMVPPNENQYRSRGHLVLDLAASRNDHDMIRKLHHQSFDAFRPFIIVLFTSGDNGVVARWNGRQFSEINLTRQALPLTTSSFRTAEVLEERKRLFHEMMKGDVPTDRRLADYHKSRSEKGGAYSVAMSRPDACTVSFNLVNIGSSTVSFHYEERDQSGDDPAFRPAVTVEMPRS